MNEAALYDHLGYLIVKNLFSHQEIGTLAKIVDRIYDQWLQANHAAYIQHKLVNMHSLTSPHYFAGHAAERLQFFQLIASEKLTNLMRNLFGDGLYFHNTQLFFNPFENGRLPYWHRDMQYSPVDDSTLKDEQHNMVSLHVRIPLVPEKGVELIPGTHKRWDTELERNVRLELNGHKNHDDLPDAVLTELLPGDVMIFSAQMIHRGNYALNKSRKALDLCIGKPHHLTSPYLDASTLPNADELAKIPSNQWYLHAHDVATANTNPPP